MENEEIEKDEIEDFEISFIDPSELVDFVAEEESGAIIEPDDTEEELPFTTKIRKHLEDQQYRESVKESVNAYVTKKQEDTRGRLALVYTIFTFVIFVIGIVVSIIDGLNRKVSIIDNLSVIIPLISGVFLGSLGFVLGYYFKKEERK